MEVIYYADKLVVTQYASTPRLTENETLQVSAMVSGFERFQAAAVELGVPVEPVRYPEGTRTAADAAAAVGCGVGQIVKSLVFATPTKLVLALTSGANQVDIDRLGELAGEEINLADPEAVRAATGFAIGGTPPFGLSIRFPSGSTRTCWPTTTCGPQREPLIPVFPSPRRDLSTPRGLLRRTLSSGRRASTWADGLSTTCRGASISNCLTGENLTDRSPSWAAIRRGADLGRRRRRRRR